MSILHKALNDVRVKLNDKVREVKVLRHLYQAQCDEVKIWRNKYDQLRNENVRLDNICAQQKIKLQTCKCKRKNGSKNGIDSGQSKFMRIKWKPWDELKDSSKYKRKLEYKRILEDSLIQLKECKSVNVQLVVGSDIIKLCWSPRNMLKLKGSIPCKKGELIT